MNIINRYFIWPMPSLADRQRGRPVKYNGDEQEMLRAAGRFSTAADSL